MGRQGLGHRRRPGRLLGLSPGNDTFQTVPLAAADSTPYSLTPGPDGALWFTQIGSGQIGTLFPNGTVLEHAVRVPEYINGTSSPIEAPGVPAQIAFANSTTGYFVDASPLISGSAVFAFDPGHFSPRQFGTNQSLSDPDSIALGAGSIWLAQHGDSSLAMYDTEARTWTVYPTSTVPYIRPTLPYFVEANGSSVWFNEHFGNRMAVLNLPQQTLTEYSLSNPAANNISQIGNALTSALGPGKAWFTELTANAVGYVDAAYQPSFGIAPLQGSSLSVHKGETASIGFDLQGNSSSPISVRFTESAPPSANITMNANETSLASLAGSRGLDVTIAVPSDVAPGSFTLLVTASDGLTSRSAVVELSVLP